MIKFILFLFKFFLVIFIFEKYFQVEITYADECKKYKNNKEINLDQKFKRLHQISNAHSQCLINMQQQLSDNKKNIDILRGNIQDIHHNMNKILDTQNKSLEKINAILKKNTHIYNNVPHLHANTEKKRNDDTIIFNSDIAYKQAVSLVLEKKQYDQAIKAFQDFIKNYPESDYQSNANYWLGQLYYNKGNKDNACYHFALVVKNYPKSLKASDSLLKIGIIMQETEKKEKAKVIYQQIGKLYPDSDAAKQAQKRLTHL